MSDGYSQGLKNAKKQNAYEEKINFFKNVSLKEIAEIFVVSFYSSLDLLLCDVSKSSMKFTIERKRNTAASSDSSTWKDFEKWHFEVSLLSERYYYSEKFCHENLLEALSRAFLFYQFLETKTGQEILEEHLDR